ncbi:unnamed protein product [Aphanomyces euteiches]
MILLRYLVVVAFFVGFVDAKASKSIKAPSKAVKAVPKPANGASKSGGGEKKAKSSAGFCWKNSFGRGAGSIPQSCDPGQDRLGLLCYDKCPSGYSRKGLDCHQNCPSGFDDQGLFCRMKEYGRGGGYPWKFGDALNLNKARERCERDNGKGNCEQNGAIIYPKCKPGYDAFGCCLCRPKAFDCRKLGMQGQLDLSCSKFVQIGKPHVGKCPAGDENQAGLCYKKCKGGYGGVGPVCWAGNPSGWSNCGFGAAESSRRCAEVIKDQIMSVGQLAFNVVSGGAAKGLQSAWKAVKSKDVIQKAMKKISGKGFGVISKLEDSKDPADAVRLAAAITAMFDPTGVSDVVESFAFSTCDKVHRVHALG